MQGKIMNDSPRPKLKLSRKQLDVFGKTKAKLNILEGAVRSGKSFVLNLRFLEELENGPEGDYAIIGKSERAIIRNILGPLNHLVGGIIKFNKMWSQFMLFGRIVWVVGANDERAVGKIQGCTLAGCLVDEMTLIPENFFNILLSRLSVTDSKLFGSCNPEGPYHWLKVNFIDKFKDDPNYLCDFKFTLEDNPSLDEPYKEHLKKSLSGMWYKRLILGEWVQAEGAIFDFFNTKYHVVQAPPSYAKYFILGVDYGTKNAFAATLIGFNDDIRPSIWIQKEYYWDSVSKGYQKTDYEYMQDIQREFGLYPIRTIYLDPSAASFEQELKRNKMPVKQAKNDVLDGIRFVSALFMQGDLVVCKECVNLIKEIESYVWDEKSLKLGEDKPLKQRDHALDAMRYGLYTEFGGRKSLKGPEPQKPQQGPWYQPPAPDNWIRF
jgi:PBSX family phage terminase large subunit